MSSLFAQLPAVIRSAIVSDRRHERLLKSQQLGFGFPVPAGNWRAWFLVGARGAGKSHIGRRVCLAEAFGKRGSKIVAFSDSASRKISELAAEKRVGHQVCPAGSSVSVGEGSRIVGDRRAGGVHLDRGLHLCSDADLVWIDDIDVGSNDELAWALVDDAQSSVKAPRLLFTLTDVEVGEAFIAKVAGRMDVVVTHIRSNQ